VGLSAGRYESATFLDRRTGRTREAGLVYGVEPYEPVSSWVAPHGSSGLREAHAPSGYWGDCRLTYKPLPGAGGLGDDGQEVTGLAEAGPGQYSFLISKKEPRIVPASLDFCLANLNLEASSAGTSIPSESLNPTARFLGASTVYITLIDRPLS
jgi:hypothetical protein